MIRVFEAFAGYGSQSLALERLGVPHEVVAISEIDKYAIQAYKALHGEVLNLGDISKISIDDVPDHDLFTYSFPCQDISVAGKQQGFEKGSGTRSGLLWECERIIQGKKPKYLLMENVKNLVGKKNKPSFEKWCEWLEEQGYTNYWQVLNAKDYGVPQNRERVFMISILGEHAPYKFPKGFDNGIRLKDILEDEVDEKYYISNDKAEKLIQQLKDGKQGIFPSGDKVECTSALGSREHRSSGWKETVGTLCARDYKDPKVVCEPNVMRYERTEYGRSIRKAYEVGDIKEKIGNMRAPIPRTDGIANTLTSVQKDNMLCIPCLTPDRLEKRQNGRRFKEDGEPMFTLTGQDRHGVLQVGNYRGGGGKFENPQAGRVYDANGISPTLNTMQGGIDSLA